MAILHSCCFWKSLRRGAYASVIYTLIYYGGACLVETNYLEVEREYLAGNVENPLGESFLERERVSSTTVIFHIILLFCSACGVIACLLVFYGLKTDQRHFLLPWIAVMVADILIEFIHFIYMIITDALCFDPIVATMYTIDFFLVCINIYCLLCVVSQYQEYKAGRGYARSQNNVATRPGSIRYVPPRPTTHAHRDEKRTRKSRTMNNSIYCTKCTATKNTNFDTMNKPPLNPLRPPSVLKKHVQFPDTFNSVVQEVFSGDDSNGNGSDTVAIETPPSVIVVSF